MKLVRRNDLHFSAQLMNGSHNCICCKKSLAKHAMQKYEHFDHDDPDDHGYHEGDDDSDDDEDGPGKACNAEI